MGKASSAKKVARAARAGGNRRAGQRRALGFPVAIGLVLVLGLLLVFFARERRNADAFPRANKDHVHSSIDIYTCTPDTSSTPEGSTTTTTTTTTTTVPASSAPGDSTTTTSTTPATSTTQLGSNDVHGQYQAAPKDALQTDTNGIHTHGDGLMHIHPFTDSAAGRKATLGLFLDQVGISITDNTLTIAEGTFTEGKTKCEGGKDGVVQVAKWDRAADAAKGDKPNQIFTSGFDKIRLGANESFVIAFMPDGSTLKAKPDVVDRIAKVTDVAPSTTAPSASGSSGAPSSGSPSSGSPSSGSPSSGSPSSGSPSSGSPSSGGSSSSSSSP
jgi:cytoskeletal protein RodZ